MDFNHCVCVCHLRSIHLYNTVRKDRGMRGETASVGHREGLGLWQLLKGRRYDGEAELNSTQRIKRIEAHLWFLSQTTGTTR